VNRKKIRRCLETTARQTVARSVGFVFAATTMRMACITSREAAVILEY